MADHASTPGGDHQYAIGVGSNRGDREATIHAAAGALAASDGIRLCAQSRLHATAPVGGPPGQGTYLNGAWLIMSALGPHQLLQRLQAIEQGLGRVRSVPWGPRTIDLDLLLRDDGASIATAVLTLPHPRIAQRWFVLRPLADIVPTWTIPHPSLPGRRITIRELLQLVASPHGAES